MTTRKQSRAKRYKGHERDPVSRIRGAKVEQLFYDEVAPVPPEDVVAAVLRSTSRRTIRDDHNVPIVLVVCDEAVREAEEFHAQNSFLRGTKP